MSEDTRPWLSGSAHSTDCSGPCRPVAQVRRRRTRPHV